MAAQELASQVGIAPACRALGVSRATLYRRHRAAPGHQQPRPMPARALCAAEREHVLDVLSSPRFVDRSPGEVMATLLQAHVSWDNTHGGPVFRAAPILQTRFRCACRLRMTDSKINDLETDPGGLAALLRAHCITSTPQRLKLAAILLARPQHLSAERLLQLANREDPVVSKATVYNTLGLFAERGLVREVVVDPAKIFYDSNPSEHYHFYDLSTGELTDIDRDRIEIGEIPDLPPGASVEGVDVIVRIRGRGD